MSLLNNTGEGKKKCIATSEDRTIKGLGLGEKRKSCGCTQGEMKQANAILSERTVRRKMPIFGLNA